MKAKKEVVIVNLINEPRLVMNLLAVGKEDGGAFPNSQSNLVIRRLRTMESKKRNARWSELHEITIPRACVQKIASGIEKFLDTTEVKTLDKSDKDIRAVAYGFGETT